MTKTRVSVPSDLVADVMFASDATCCVCRERGKAVQVHHVDEDPGNNVAENLAVLCLECHNGTQVTGGFGRKLNDTLVIKYRDEWYQRVTQRRDAADLAALERMRGPAVASPTGASMAGAVDTLLYCEARADAILAYVQSLPDLRSGLRQKAQAGWDTGVTATMVQASYDYIDAMQGVLVTLAGFYPRGSFGEDPHRFFSQLIASRYGWHRTHAEPHGPGTGGTIVNVICSGNVVEDAEKMVEDMAQSLVGYDDRFDWKAWPGRWRANTI
jgi:hypothetical protein